MVLVIGGPIGGVSVEISDQIVPGSLIRDPKGLLHNPRPGEDIASSLSWSLRVVFVCVYVAPDE